jgi:alpha-tubulin suppressor-like RCC1 family protein
MFTKKSLWVLTISLSIIFGHGMAVTCGRLEKVSAGEFHSLALADDGTLWACGDNSDYQSGLGSSVDHTYSLMKVLGENGIGQLKNIITFDAGWYHSLAAAQDGTLWSWGTNTNGQLGIGNTKEDQYLPVRVHDGDVNTTLGYLEDINDIDAGYVHSLALDDVNGFVWAWDFYSRNLRSLAKAVLGFTPQAFDQSMNSVTSTRLLEVSQL